MYTGAESTFEILLREISKSTSPLLVSQDIQSQKLQSIRNLFNVNLIIDELKTSSEIFTNNDYLFINIHTLIKFIDKKLLILFLGIK